MDTHAQIRLKDIGGTLNSLTPPNSTRSFDPDYEKSYPGKAQQLHFLRRYVEALRARRPEEGGIADLGK